VSATWRVQPGPDEVFRQVDQTIKVQWLFQGCEELQPGPDILQLSGPARGLLTAEAQVQ